MRRYYIVEGDKTTANGTVQKHSGTASTTSWHGKTVSNIKDTVLCPVCKSIGVIKAIGARNPFDNKGFIPALNDDLCICKCNPPPRLIHSQIVFYQDISNTLYENDDIEELHNQSNLVDMIYQSRLILVNEKGDSLANYHYRIDFSDGTTIEGQTDNEGKTKVFNNSKEIMHIWYQINKGIEL